MGGTRSLGQRSGTRSGVRSRYRRGSPKRRRRVAGPVGTLLDPIVFIDLKRAVRRQRPEDPMGAFSRHLETQLAPVEEVGIAAITASGLLDGVHRAIPQHRGRRKAFAETVIAALRSCAPTSIPAPASSAQRRACARAHRIERLSEGFGVRKREE